MILAAGVGTAFLVRFLRRRRDEMELEMEELEEPVEGVRIRKHRRKARRHEATVHHPA